LGTERDDVAVDMKPVSLTADMALQLIREDERRKAAVLKGTGLGPRAAEAALPLRLVHAAQGKGARAEPVAALFEGGRAKPMGVFPDLEDELAGLIEGRGYEGPGRSPDRADAMVWAMRELMLGKPARVPRISAI
jgi:phage terminase large subunit-like protein